MEADTPGIGILRCGQGPVCALRFDIDALGVLEDENTSHRPARRALHRSAPASCTPVGHTAIGLGVAEVLMNLRAQLHGTVN